MTKTDNIGLRIFPSNEWATTLQSEFIQAVFGSEATSNMMILDSSIGAIQELLSSLETDLHTI